MSLKIIVSIAALAFAIGLEEPAVAHTPHASVTAHIPSPGTPVVSSDGQSIGVVASAPRGASRVVEISTEQQLGFGEKLISVDISKCTVVNNVVRIELTAAEAERLPHQGP